MSLTDDQNEQRRQQMRRQLLVNNQRAIRGNYIQQSERERQATASQQRRSIFARIIRKGRRNGPQTQEA
jgi:hypothetical protein